MPKAWSDKRERQYEHIKDSLQARGKKEKTAEEIAARTVNKESCPGLAISTARHVKPARPRPRTLPPLCEAVGARTLAKAGARSRSCGKRRADASSPGAQA